jgi:hypothetical protein
MFGIIDIDCEYFTPETPKRSSYQNMINRAERTLTFDTILAHLQITVQRVF